jgi:type IV fimbrial biogenesis protein FimT
MLIVLTSRRQQGFTLIELIIVVCILGILMALGLPAYNQMIMESAIRAKAESFLSGLQLAKVEAMKRNMSVRFQIFDSQDSTCQPVTAGLAGDASWVVSRNSAVGKCDATADPAVAVAPTSGTTFVLYKSTQASRGNIDVTTGNALFCFDSVGLLTNVPSAANNNCTGAAVATTNIDFTPTGGGCRATVGGPGIACRRVAVSAGGNAKLCDPLVTTAGDSRACP